jgi:hypothetical protein
MLRMLFGSLQPTWYSTISTRDGTMRGLLPSRVGVLTGKFKLPRPLYIATVALGLTAGLLLATKGKDQDADVQDVMARLGFTNKAQYETASHMLEARQIVTLSEVDEKELERLLHAKGMQNDIGYGIIGNLSKETLQRKYLSYLLDLQAKQPESPHIRAVLARWVGFGGKQWVRELAAGNGGLSVDAKEVLTP